ncbi:hypothetical protein [Hyphomonas sp.]|uniref:hypothetical protein n=1 Tax=Hyphomonas sp. TaxID=87 RepID=UPI003001FB44
MTDRVEDTLRAQWGAIETEAYERHRKANSGAIGQILEPSNSVEYWFVVVALERFFPERGAKDATIRALQAEVGELRERLAGQAKLVAAGAHLGLAGSDIRNDDMSPSPETNDWHMSEAKRLASEAFNESEQAEMDRMLRDLETTPEAQSHDL